MSTDNEAEERNIGSVSKEKKKKDKKIRRAPFLAPNP